VVHVADTRGYFAKRGNGNGLVYCAPATAGAYRQVSLVIVCSFWCKDGIKEMVSSHFDQRQTR
jgi:hypothetical protein